MLFYLVDSKFLDYLEKGLDYFEYTVFKRVINKEYPDRKKLLEKIYELKKPLDQKYNELHNKEIERIFEVKNQLNQNSKLKRIFRSFFANSKKNIKLK